MVNGIGGLAAAAGGFAQAQQQSRLFDLQKQQIEAQQGVARSQLQLAQRQQSALERQRVGQLGLQQEALDIKKTEAAQKTAAAQKIQAAATSLSESRAGISALTNYGRLAGMTPDEPGFAELFQQVGQELASSFRDDEGINRFSLELTDNGVPLVIVTNTENEQSAAIDPAGIAEWVADLENQRKVASVDLFAGGEISFEEFNEEIGLAQRGVEVLSVSSAQRTAIVRDPDGGLRLIEFGGGPPPEDVRVVGNNLVVRNKTTGEVETIPIVPNMVGQVITTGRIRVRGGGTLDLKQIIRQAPDGTLFLEDVKTPGAVVPGLGDPAADIKGITEGL